MLSKGVLLQRAKRFFYEHVVPLSVKTWLRRGSFVALLLAWIFLFQVVHRKNVSLIDVTASMKVDAALDLIKVGKVADTIRFGVWGFCNGEATLSTIIHTWHIDPVCKPHSVNFNIGSEVSEVFDLEKVDVIKQEVETVANVFVKLHPFSMAMGIIGWIMSMSRRRIFKWRTRTILHLPHPEWAIIPSAIGILATIILHIYFLVLSKVPHNDTVYKMNLKVFSVNVTLDVEGGNARYYDTAGTVCFAFAIFLYLIWLRRRSLPVRLRELVEQDQGPETIPIVQVDELVPRKLFRRKSQPSELPGASTSIAPRSRSDSMHEDSKLSEAPTFPTDHTHETYAELPMTEKEHVSYYTIE